MDNATTAVLENVTLSYLNEQFKGILEVNEVTVLSQSFGQSSVDTAGKSRYIIRAINGRRLRRPSIVRSLAERLLMVDLNVDGTISNWTSLNEANDFQDSNDSISTTLAEVISSNNEEFMGELANKSDFFTSSSKQTPSFAVSSTDAPTVNEKLSRNIVIASGAVVAFVALVGSVLYMKRKSGTKRSRRNDDENREEFAYDLSRVGKSGEDHMGDDGYPSSEKVGKEACPGPMKPKSPKQAKIDARMTSLLDQVCLAFMIHSTHTSKISPYFIVFLFLAPH